MQSRPPGEWDQPAAQANDSSYASASSLKRPLLSWADLPADPTVLLPMGPFFLEIFAGTAGLTEAVSLLGVANFAPN